MPVELPFEEVDVYEAIDLERPDGRAVSAGLDVRGRRKQPDDDDDGSLAATTRGDPVLILRLSCALSVVDIRRTFAWLTPRQSRGRHRTAIQETTFRTLNPSNMSSTSA